MFFKRKGDFVMQSDGTLLMNGEWYDTQEDLEDEDVRPWLIDQIPLPINDAAHATVELLEEKVAERAAVHAPMRQAQLSKDSLDDRLPAEVEAVFGRNKAVNADSVLDRVMQRKGRDR